MSLPDLSGNFGVALIRKPAGGADSTYEFVQWLTSGTNFVEDIPGAGAWNYVLVLVCGASSGATGMQYEGRVQLSALALKR